MGDEENVRTLPRPPAMPGMLREEPQTPAPRKSSLEELRASAEPPAWLIAIDELRADMLAKLGGVAEETDRASRANHEQQEKLNELERWKKDVEDNAKTAAEEARRGASFAEQLVTTVTKKWITPQTVAVAIGTFVTVVAGILNAVLKAKGLVP
jgi:hypothetical protein